MTIINTNLDLLINQYLADKGREGPGVGDQTRRPYPFTSSSSSRWFYCFCFNINTIVLIFVVVVVDIIFIIKWFMWGGFKWSLQYILFVVNGVLGTARAGSSRLELLKPNGFFVLSTNQNNKITVLKSLTRNSTLHLQGFLNLFCVSFCVEQVRVSPPFLTVSVSLCYTPGFYFLAWSQCKLFACHFVIVIVIIDHIAIAIVSVILSFITTNIAVIFQACRRYHHRHECLVSQSYFLWSHLYNFGRKGLQIKPFLLQQNTNS